MGRNTKTVTDFDAYLNGIRSLPADPGDKVVAYFDLDRTLIGGYSITALALEEMWSGGLSPSRILTHASIFLGWGLGRSDYHELLEATAKRLVGKSEADMVELGQRAYLRRLKPIIYDEGRRLIAAHQSRGHEVVIVTSASRYQAEPVAEDLGVETLFCTELEIEAGLITGRVRSCYGVGKRLAAVAHSADVAANLEDAYFYSDSAEDLPLLEAVGKPVAVNPKSSLARHAARRRWPVLAFVIQGDASSAEAA